MKTTKQKSREQFALAVAENMNLGSNHIELCEEHGDVTAIIKDGNDITIVQELAGISEQHTSTPRKSKRY